jgi:hypothetical protein
MKEIKVQAVKSTVEECERIHWILVNCYCVELMPDMLPRWIHVIFSFFILSLPRIEPA